VDSRAILFCATVSPVGWPVPWAPGGDFRHDCDELLSFHSVRALLDFLDSDSSLLDFFEEHGDLFDFLVHHSDWSDDFDSDCTLIELHS
jgi:hypothetical protein